MTRREKENMAELIAALRAYPVLGFNELRVGQQMGHMIGLAHMVLMQRINVIEALENFKTGRPM